MSMYSKNKSNKKTTFKYSRTENGANGYDVNSIHMQPLVKALYCITRQTEGIETNKCLIEYQKFIKSCKTIGMVNYATKFAFMVRDIIGGQGRRDLGRELIYSCLIQFKNINAQKLTDILTKDMFGRWDDILWLIDKFRIGKSIYEQTYCARLIDIVTNQLFQDVVSSGKSDSDISLLAKWMPSINASSDNTRKQARFWVNQLKLDYKQYRHILSRLRTHVGIVEKNIVNSDYQSIEYSHVPAQAMIRYKGQFIENDQDRYYQYLDDVKSGSTKINTKTLSVPEIIHQYLDDAIAPSGTIDKSIETIWKRLRTVKFQAPIIPVCDVSGSMFASIAGSKIKSIDVSVGLSIFFSQCNTGGYHNKIISFTDEASCIDLSKCNTLLDKIRMVTERVGYSTNIENVLNMLYEISKNSENHGNNIPTLIFFSDMEFNDQVQDCRNTKTIFEQYQKKFERSGLKFPRVVFWNINNRSNTIQIVKNKSGIIMCSGFSQNMIEMITKNDYDSWNALKRVLDKARYNQILSR